MKTALQQLIDVIPSAEEITQYIFENQADTKMVEDYLWRKMFKNKNWIELEKQQIINAVDGFPLQARDLNGKDYYEEVYGNK